MTTPPPGPQEPYTLAQVMPPAPVKRHRWPWIVGAGVFAAVAVVGAAAILSHGGVSTPAAAPATAAAPVTLGDVCNKQGAAGTTTAGVAVVCRTVNGAPIWVDPAAAAPVEAPAITYAEPVLANFRITVKVLRKKCFGSAGCNVTFQIDPKYIGTLDPSKTYRVTYEVRGVEDGPQINNFTVSGDTASVDSEEDATTTSTKVKLTARVTDVAEE